MIGGVVTFIALMALGYLIFVYAGKQTGLNKILGYVIVGIIVVALIALPVFTCARNFGKGGFQGCAIGKGAGPGKQGCCPEMRQGNRPFGFKGQGCPMQGPQGSFEVWTDDGNFKGEEDIVISRSIPGVNPNAHIYDLNTNPFPGMQLPKDILNGAAEMIQKDPKLVDEFIKALKDKPEALKALKDKLK